MSALLAVLILGLVQGLTEFLPISSSGHLVLGQYLLGYQPQGLALEASVHLATLGAIVAFYRERLFQSFRWEAVLWRQVGVAFLITAVLGLLLRSRVEEGFTSLKITGWGWLFTGVVLLATSWRLRRAGTGIIPGWWGAVLVGVAQGLALFPGVSRSGMTIAAGLWVGLAPEGAARFSFFLALPTILGATVYELGQGTLAPQTTAVPWSHLLVASLVAGVSGWLAIGWLLHWLKRRLFWLFGVYCLAIGSVGLALAYRGG